MKYLISIIALLLPLHGLASDRVLVDEIRTVYDADTFFVNINSWPPIFGERIGVRVANVDAPEMRGKCKEEKLLARKAKKHTVAFLRNAKRVELTNIERGKYFRIVADVYADGRSLSDSLVASGFAVRYTGGKRISWCSNE